jgi:RHS repeat-associated protein
VHTQNTTNLNTFSYIYDAVSRITQMTSIDGTSTYSYDDTDQLTSVTQSFQPNEAYSYDLNGNRTIANYQTTTNNRLTSDGTYNYLYDDEGNLTRRTTIATNETTEYTWDYRNRLTQVTLRNASNVITRQVNFVYDALNRRIEKRVDPDGSGPNPATIERFIYDRDHIKLVFNGTNTLIRRYLHGPAIDQILADETNTSQVFWALSDHQGTVRDWINNSAVVQNHIRYDSFGRITSQTAPTFNPRFAYTGREWDREIGLYFYRARYYDAGVGRFIGEDPLGLTAGDANLHRYVINAPINNTDVFGLAPNTGFCTAAQYAPLRDKIKANCPGKSSTGAMSCNKPGFEDDEGYLLDNLRKFIACGQARYLVSEKCFKGHPDYGKYKQPIDEAIGGAKKCRDKLKDCRFRRKIREAEEKLNKVYPVPETSSPSWEFPWWIFSIPSKVLDPLGDFGRPR